ncbi:uncharacterized protein C11orf52 homolog isoform X2 [Perognathus longimembris pacificus]|uniref:uncharacterized protein C11orf52 homolog isoform X2 n=1 Tax=Perognathus longimembris pacificus TaxID=214514 RepID=UPI002018770D|nr:uncharacterized protein C11orf52 homolog isoform X2 [Perognathus longimembris pacificus]
MSVVPFHLPEPSMWERSCMSIFQKKNKAENQVRRTSKHQQQEELQKNGSKGHETTGHTYERVLQQSVSQRRSQDLTSDSNLHYADIQVCTRTQPRSASEVKHKHLETATEYATLHFPQASPRYDSKNGTLV